MEVLNRLSDREIKSAKPMDKDYRLSDGGGLYLVVTASGGKLWRWSFQFNGKEKLLSYGPYPFISLARARQLRADARALKCTGIDPAADKQSKKRAALESEKADSMATFADLTEESLLAAHALRTGAGTHGGKESSCGSYPLPRHHVRAT